MTAPSPANHVQGLQKAATGITGFDHIAERGIPRGRCTLLAGTAGSGKTIFALQFLCGAAARGEAGVLVTFEECPGDIISNVESLGFRLSELIDRGMVAIVDASPTAGDALVETGAYDLSALMARIEHAARTVEAQHAVIDSVGALFPNFSDGALVRRELHRVVTGLRQLQITTLMTIERTSDNGPVARFGVEEFVADNVVVLRNTLEQEKRRRTDRTQNARILA